MIEFPLIVQTNVHPNTDGSPWGWLVDFKGRRLGTWTGHSERAAILDLIVRIEQEQRQNKAYRQMMLDKTETISDQRATIERLTGELDELGAQVAPLADRVVKGLEREKRLREALELLDDTLCDTWGPGPWHDTQEAIIAVARKALEGDE